MRSHAAALRRRLDQVRTVDDEKGAHRARIAGKRLRYLLEPIVPHVAEGSATLSRLKALQDAFGDFHDAHVWEGVIVEALEQVARDEIAQRERADDEVAAEPPTEGAPLRRRSHKRSARPGLEAILGHVRARTARCFEVLQRDWSGEALAPLFDGAEAIAVDLDVRARSGVEIERKYLLRGLPSYMPEAFVQEIAQGYLPGTRLVERLRRVRSGEAERYVRTVKSGTGLVRTELEEECTREVFEALWPLTEGRRVLKRRHVIPDGALHWEIDEFTDRDLVLAEIELPSADITAEFPAWLLSVVERDVTGRGRLRERRRSPADEPRARLRRHQRLSASHRRDQRLRRPALPPLPAGDGDDLRVHVSRGGGLRPRLSAAGDPPATEMMLPTPGVRRQLHDVLRAQRPDIVLFGALWPLGHMGPAIARKLSIPYGGFSHGLELTGALVPGLLAAHRRSRHAADGGQRLGTPQAGAGVRLAAGACSSCRRGSIPAPSIRRCRTRPSGPGIR